MSDTQLTIHDHRRDQAGLRYIYSVVSRRAGGLSIGINLNTNRACNWACIYCQVEGLTRGAPPPVDLERLENELAGFLERVVHGEYLERHVAAAQRRLADIAFSGDGEPTSAAEFPEAVHRVAATLARFRLTDSLPLRLITNGSLIHRPRVQEGLAALAAAGGELWFKVDRGDEAGRRRVNKTRIRTAQVLANLRRATELAPTWVQTCWFAYRGAAPDESERRAYLQLIAAVADRLRGIHLYGLARPSGQPEAAQLTRLPAEALQDWGMRIEKETGVRVIVSP